jgi:uncharacterized protein YyaL (SSP411 family)
MPNQLINARSPYLLQHANNPVEWMPWGSEALEIALNSDKLLIISVGYSACHWCHVMEHESFEDEEVASLMNRHFVSIKVDREERPDVDQVYMNAAMLITGSGGWPLNAIALPDGRPVYAGTYFPKAQWMRVLAYFADLYQNNRAKLEEQATNLTQGIQKLDHAPKLTHKVEPDQHLLSVIWQHWRGQIDMEYGGRKGAPKFMMPNQYDFLLKYALSSGNEEVAHFIKVTLQKMALGGLFDQLGGGFTRYSTDPYWKVPHFEKMLYDNGQLLGLYAQAYRAYKEPFYLEVIDKTMQWLEREMKASDGGYFAALDADSEGVEGKFYVWTSDELRFLLGKDAPAFMEYYSCTDAGNWEHDWNVLHATISVEAFAKEKGLETADLKSLLQRCQGVLFKERAHRIRPGLDDKRIAGWNALLLSGFCEVYKATGDLDTLKKAKELAKFFTAQLSKDDGGLWHTFNRGEAYLDGYLSDYAPAIAAFLNLYQVTLEESYLLQARSWMEYCIEHFYDEASGLFFLTSDDAETLVSRPRELSDNVISASNSILARSLWQLGHYFDQEVLKEMADVMLQTVLQDALRNGPFYAEWASLLWEMIYPPYEVAFTSEEASAQAMQLLRQYLPQVITMGPSEKIPLMEGKTSPQIYVCRNHTCLTPLEEVSEVSAALKW